MTAIPVSKALHLLLQVLKQLLDRGHMPSGRPGDKGSAQPYPDVGVGYEVVKHGDGAGLLAGVNQ